jgi:hypothetical protein
MVSDVMPEILAAAVETKQHGLAIDDKRTGPIPPCRLGDQGLAGGPVEAVLCEQPDALSLALDDHPIAVMLNLVNPIRAIWNLDSAVWKAGKKR